MLGWPMHIGTVNDLKNRVLASLKPAQSTRMGRVQRSELLLFLVTVEAMPGYPHYQIASLA